MATTTKRAAVADAIRDQIRTGELRPGQRLPGIPDYMLQWGVSLHTVRAAQQQLVSEGLLQTVQGVGAFVVEEVPDSQMSNEELLRALQLLGDECHRLAAAVASRTPR